MKNNIIRTFLTFALATFGAMAASAQQKVELGGAGSSGIQPAKVNVGGKANASVLVSVIDSEGKPVQGEAANLVTVNFVVPAGAPCGMVQQSATEVKPGIYQIAIVMPALPQCVWAAGDYLATVRIGTAAYFGISPFMVSVR